MLPINNLGYGNVGYNIATELGKITNVGLFPIYDRVEKTNPIIDRAVKVGREQPVCDKYTPCIRIWHQNSMAQWVSSPRIGFPIFELDRFTDVEKHHLNIPDSLFVPSKWAAEIVKNEINRDAKVIPLGFDPSIFYPSVINKPDTTVFLNSGKWEVRKGHDILCELFNRAFDYVDDVELWMINDNPFLTKEEQKSLELKYKQSPLGNKIRIIPRYATQKQLANLMRLADFGIFPTRAEGWNLEGLEMIACGKRIITTKYSAHTEYISKHNSFGVEIDTLEPAYDGRWFFKQGNWAHIGEKEKEKFIDWMRYCHKNKQSLINDISETVKQFTWENTAKKIVESI